MVKECASEFDKLPLEVCPEAVMLLTMPEMRYNMFWAVKPMAFLNIPLKINENNDIKIR